jgi:hypothetical protein
MTELLIRLAEIIIPVIITSLAVILPSMWQIKKWQAEAIKLIAEAETDSDEGQSKVTKTLMESTGIIIGHYIAAQGEMNKRLEHLEVELAAVKQERDKEQKERVLERDRMQKEIDVFRVALDDCLKKPPDTL